MKTERTKEENFPLHHQLYPDGSAPLLSPRDALQENVTNLYRDVKEP